MTRIVIKSICVGASTLAVGAIGLASAFAATPSDMKMTSAQCGTLWTQALAGSSGDLTEAMAAPYVADFKKADTNGDDKLSQPEWTSACEQGSIKSSSSGAVEGPAIALEKTSDRTPGDPAPTRTPGATSTGAAGTEAAQTPSGTSDRTPNK